MTRTSMELDISCTHLFLCYVHINVIYISCALRFVSIDLKAPGYHIIDQCAMTLL